MTNVLEELAIQLKNLELRKCGLLSEIADVSSKIRRVQAEHGRVTNQSASIYRLPIEILSYIFETGQKLIRREPVRGTTPLRRFELLVSHVSSHWRAVALATPTLWAYIEGRREGHGTSEKEEFEVYLTRSKACPLDVTFQLVGDVTLHREMALVPLFCAHVGRWRRVFVELMFNESYAAVTEAIGQSAAPLLERFSICTDSRLGSVIREYEGRIFACGAPRLTFVRLAGVTIHLSQPPFGAVTTLHLEDSHKTLSINYAQFRDLVNASPALVNLSLYGIIVDNWPSSHDLNPTLTIPLLRSLRIQGTSDFVYAITTAISAPQLDSLVVADSTDDESPIPWGDTPQFRSMLAPKFPHLRTLTFRDCYLTSLTCRNVFRALPTITHFALLGSFNVDTLKALGDDHTIPSDLPWSRLHTLTIERLETARESLLCANLLSGRKQLGYPISQLRLENQLRNKLKRKGKLEWLEQVVEVVKWNTIEPWPPGSDFVDENDLF